MIALPIYKVKSMLPSNCADSTEPRNQVPTLRTGMSCKSCGSENVHKFGGEITIRFPGLKNLDRPHVYVSAELAVCLDCGAARFRLPEDELRLLGKGDRQVPKTPVGGPP